MGDLRISDSNANDSTSAPCMGIEPKFVEGTRSFALDVRRVHRSPTQRQTFPRICRNVTNGYNEEARQRSLFVVQILKRPLDCLDQVLTKHAPFKSPVLSQISAIPTIVLGNWL